MARAYAQEVGEVTDVGQQPRLDLPDGNPEQHVLRGGGKVFLDELRRACSITVQVDQHEPRSDPGGCVISGQLREHGRLSVLDVDWTDIVSSVGYQTPHHGIVNRTLNDP
jgi:hypothetical protein